MNEWMPGGGIGEVWMRTVHSTPGASLHCTLTHSSMHIRDSSWSQFDPRSIQSPHIPHMMVIDKQKNAAYQTKQCIELLTESNNPTLVRVDPAIVSVEDEEWSISEDRNPPV